MDKPKLRVTDGRKVERPALAAGDVVILKTGGPIMAVAGPVPMPGELRGVGYACDWFLNGNSARAVFDEKELIRVPGLNNGEK